MAINITKKDIIWNYAGNILNIGMNIFLLPVILLMLNSQEIGLWYVFSSISALAMLIDFGFSPTIMRNVSYSWSGAKELLTEGTMLSELNEKPNYYLLRAIIVSSKKIYAVLSTVSGLLLFSLGTIYIYSLLPDDKTNSLIAWFIYILATIINLYYSYWNPLLKGIGAIKEDNQALVISRLTYVVFSIIGLLLGGGLIWLSLMYLISGVILRVLAKKYFSKKVRHEDINADPGNGYSFKTVFSIIWPNAKKLGVVTIGAWLITRSTTLICATYLGLDVTAQYGLSMQVLGIIGSFSSILFNSYIPELASLKMSINSNTRYLLIFSRAITTQWILGIVGILGVVLVGPFALNIIGSNSTLLPNNILIVLGLVLFLEWNHSTFATLITMSNTVPFVQASVFSGVGIVVISLILLEYTNMGILGVILSQGIIQASYNNWKWPLWVLRENNITVLRILKLSFRKIKEVVLKQR
ncbi:O-unit flippase-like protein [Robertmurraya kyonggiensis]|uniref:Membrane protein involved in the export of O-antigen and teichoic acid n=1 Tax=Robertmurraya kyonggiensis TaxID=1037680 RepID=A0A4U1D455_9BACI|nr:O-unit flippase-like protein [Robertmurraya kyonggiensis]TKC16984.1 hypothetical protein FA727_13060 [Robertmurraya kyonggiensis]